MKKFCSLLTVLALCFALSPELFAAGGKVVGKVIEETLEAAAKSSGRTLTRSMRKSMSKTLVKVVAKHGDDVLPLVRKGGLEMLEQGAKHGDDFWRLCRTVPEASRALALHADDLLPLARRVGPAALTLEAKAPGLALRAAKEFGDDGVRLLAKVPADDATRLLGYAAKADSPATRELLLKSYRTSKDPGKFLEHLNWGHIMAAGLSTAMIVSAYKVSNGVEKAIVEHPEIAGDVVGGITGKVIIALLVILGVACAPGIVRRGIQCRNEWKNKENHNSQN